MLRIINFVILIALAIGILFLVANWCNQDARRRGKSPIFVFMAVTFFFPWGWIAWLIFRSDPIEPKEPPFDLQDYQQQ